MDFSIDQTNVQTDTNNNQQDNLLEATFAKFGLDLNDEAATIPTSPSKEAGQNGEGAEDGKDNANDPASDINNFLSSVQLPDFNTKEHKIKRILDKVPNFDWLFN